MKRILGFVSWAIGGLFIGGFSALWMGGMIPGGPTFGAAMDLDGWISDWSVGSENADPYVRARIARHGLLALTKQEAVYFIKDTDDDGELLSEACSYRVSGSAMPADWWSLTLYDGDSRLPMNEDAALSFDATKAASLAPGAADWQFLIAPTRQEQDNSGWVSSQAAGEFDLTLRLYKPAETLLADPKTLVLPTIERLSCDWEAS